MEAPIVVEVLDGQGRGYASDVVSVHTPLTDETRGMIGAREIAAMKPTGVIMNVGRGQVIDESALVEALRERRIRGAVLDGAKVIERRNIAPEAARLLADGRIYTADQALSQRLVDRLGYLPDAIDIAKGAAGVDEARVIVYHRPREYRATYYAQAATPEPMTPLSIATLAALLGPGPRFLYVWWP